MEKDIKSGDVVFFFWNNAPHYQRIKRIIEENGEFLAVFGCSCSPSEQMKVPIDLLYTDKSSFNEYLKTKGK